MVESNDAPAQVLTTPRNSDLAAAIVTTNVRDTPWMILNQLANMPRTPSRRALSAGPPSAYRLDHQTPTARTPRIGQRLGSAKQTIMVTPHGRAAQRELNLRRAGLTPGKDRRRSGRQQRETPRDTLRALSRLMAPRSQMIASTPKDPLVPTQKHSVREHDDWDDDPDPELPRFSLPLGDGDGEDDGVLLPPPSSKLENENFTVQSVEFGRRAQSERPQSRISLGSFGDLRMSSAFADSNDMEYERLRDAYDSSIFAAGGLQDDIGVFFGDDDAPAGEDTRTLRELDQGRFSFDTGQISDNHIPFANIHEDDTETTFIFNVPESQSLGDPEVQLGGLHGPVLDQTDDEDENDNSTKDLNGPNSENRHTQDTGGKIPFQKLNFPRSDVISASRRMAKISRKKLSKYGIEYPSLPPGLVKRMATKFARTAGNSKLKISKDTLDAIIQASDWFFEQIGDDLSAFSMHAGRKTIDESDVSTLMSRQRQTNTRTTAFSLAQKYLPRELLQELRMVSCSRGKRR